MLLVTSLVTSSYCDYAGGSLCFFLGVYGYTNRIGFNQHRTSSFDSGFYLCLESSEKEVLESKISSHTSLHLRK